MRRILGVCMILCAAGCSRQQPPAPVPHRSDFTFWVLQQVAGGDAGAPSLLARWKLLCAGNDAADPGATAAAAGALLSEAQRYLRAAPAVKRLTFTIGGETASPPPGAEAWKLRAGDREAVLLEVRNATALNLFVTLRGCASHGFYVWPLEHAVPPGASLYSLLVVAPIRPGEPEGFVAVDIGSLRGTKVQTELRLKGAFSAPDAGEPAPPPSFRRVAIRTLANDSPSPATVTFTGPGGAANLVLLSGQGVLHALPDHTTVFSPGEIVVAAPAAPFSVSARAGPGLAAPAAAVEADGDRTLTLTLAPQTPAMLAPWHAGHVYPLLSEEPPLTDTQIMLAARGFAVGHIGPSPGEDPFGRYPTTLAEPFSPGPSLVAKATALPHPVWGTVLAMNPVTLPPNLTAPPGALSDWPDILTACEEIHRLGGKAVGVPGHTPEAADLQLPLAALLRELDALCIDAASLPMWYDLLSCGVRLPPAAITAPDMAEPGRTYVLLDGGFTYERYLRALGRGAVFVTAGPLIGFTVDGRVPGDEIALNGGETVTVRAHAWEDGASVPVEIVAQGKVIRSGRDLEFEWTPPESVWIAARTPRAHTGPVYVTADDTPPFSAQAAERLLTALSRLEEHIQLKARLPSTERRAAMLSQLARGKEYLTSRLDAPLTTDPWRGPRRRMTAILRRQGIADERVLRAMERVPRHMFLPETVDPSLRRESYENYPLPIGYGQTISQPYIVAFMTESLQLKGHEKVLEIGTGSGYQAAVLGELVKDVYTIEIIAPLAEHARAVLRELNLRNIHVRVGDGYQGWPQEQPFDAIIVTAAPAHVPPALVAQLAPGGRMVVPVGVHTQELKCITKNPDGTVAEASLLPVLFVPMTGEAQKSR